MTKPSNGFSVLIVDDATALRSLLATLLKKEGYKVIGQLKDGSGVLQRVSLEKPDIVCLDLHMPGKDGMTILRELNEHYPDVAVVMMTGDTKPEVYSEATEAGADGFIQKPFSPAQIIEELGHVSTALTQLWEAVEQADKGADAKSGTSVLIADDSETMRRLLQVILQNMGLNVLGEAVNGQQAIELVETLKPDLLCMDIEMPVKDGLSALRVIHEKHPKLPVIMITSRSDKASVTEAIKSGALGYITKPYQPDKVAAEIKRLMKVESSILTGDDFDAF